MLGVAILSAFTFYESKAAAPIMPHRISSSRTASTTLARVFLHGMSLYSLLQWLPLFYQVVMVKTVLQSAVLLLPTSAVSVIAPTGGVILVGLAKVGYRWSIRISWALTAAGTGVLVLLDTDSSSQFPTDFQFTGGGNRYVAANESVVAVGLRILQYIVMQPQDAKRFRIGCGE
ncbi:hypothetical protein P153DRAFT_79595 [Dothidotthia symphoricarpi CBS 119687]|uniref:Uncharacterized protein n=1 Tax=Dothidotthia symphoricarpi CBS 119687 TaxID=1392245 RepID=A0A6A6A644_9PLEO|nr:uncharacterized protein P153DRAFT_79595 [Dothidotthia symphoricarpi CBS 119687]KAF2126544.1 hypothetical protein P153DRAFT_79595 [Dothidotthia symphoricarpi CBS 119687]